MIRNEGNSVERSQRTALIILGMHRSGTSALARVANLAGWHMPAMLMRPAEANQSGHWESLPIVRINNKVLRALGRVWADPKPLPEGWIDAPKVAKIIAEAPKVIASEFGTADHIVVKDPRMSRLLPLWNRIFQELGYDPHCLIACRNPIEVSQSLNARDGMNRSHALLLWETYMLEAELHSRSLPRSVVHYERLLANWRDTLGPALNIGTLGFTRFEPEASKQVDAFLDPRQRNANHSEDSLFEAADIKPRIKKLYTLLQEGLTADPAATDILNVHLSRWAEEWINRSPGTGPSNFWDSLPVSFVTKSRDLAKQDKKEEAIAAARRAIEIDPTIARHHHYLASLLTGYEMYGDAETAQRNAIARYADDAHYHEGLARILQAQKNLPEAIAAMSAAIRLEPDNPKYHNFIGTLQAQAGRLDDAEHSYRRAAMLDGTQPRYFRSHSDVLRRLDRIQDAIEPASTAAALAENNTPYLAHLAKILTLAGEFERAESAQREVIDHDASIAAHHEGLARILAAQDRIPEAIAAAKAAIALSPDSAEYHHFIGDLQAQEETLVDAEQSYRQAAALNEAEPRYFKAQSEILRRLDRIDDAIGPAITATNLVEDGLGEDKAPYLLHLAKILNIAGEFERAESAFAKALETGGEGALYIEPYRDLLVRLGRPREAIKLTQRLIKAEPKSAKAQSDLAEHFIELGQAEDAMKAQAAAAQLSADALGITLDAPLPEQLISHLIDPAIDAPEGWTETDGANLKILMSWRRARDLSANFQREALSDGERPDAPRWPTGPALPERTRSKIARYGSLSARLGRVRRALQTPKAHAVPQFGPRPQLSVMIPVYNVQNDGWLRECLNSILTQRSPAPATEIVIVDDASDSNIAEEIAAEFAPRVGYSRNPKNLGIVENHNHCIRMARGELVHILHQDDWLEPGFYAKVAQPLLDNDMLVAAFSRAKIVDDEGNYRSDQPLLQLETGIADDFSAKIALRQRILFPTMIVRRSAYERVGGFSASLIFAFDLEMWARLSSAGPIWYEPTPYADYRTHQWSVTSSIANRERLVDGMQAARLNLDHIAPALRIPTLAATLYRLLLREWDGIAALDSGNEDTSRRAALLEFLLGVSAPTQNSKE